MALSLLVLFLFQKFLMPRQPQGPLEKQQVRIVQNESTTAEPLKEKVPPVVEEITQEQEIDIDTDKFKIKLSDIGGAVKEWWLKEYREEDHDELLIKAEEPGYRPFAMQSKQFPGLFKRKYQVEKRKDSIDFIIEIPGQLNITKRYSFLNSNDHINLEIFIKNLSSSALNFSYQMTGPAGISDTGKVKGRNFKEANAVIDGKIIRKTSVKNTWTQKGTVSWLGMKNRYFAAVLKPFIVTEDLVLTETNKKQLVTALTTNTYTLMPGEVEKDEYLVYGGPLDEGRLSAYDLGFENMINYGWFGGISKVLLKILRFFHKWLRNWGIAIILLTLLVNLVSFPLTRKSFQSMHQMKAIQPHMQKLKDLHKDNPQKLNKEMMELYKKYNVNPFGGCLPMLLQIPIFIALYQGLIKAVELKGARFLWIKDLAKPDAVPLPFKLPVLGGSINILPLLMVVMMLVQQRMQAGTQAAVTDEQASQQKMMMIMMPLFFGVLFYNMPSGLVLYWLTNTILMTSEQALLKSRTT